MQQNTALNLHVCEADRLSFLPYLFGDDYLLAEMQVYGTADRYLPQYTGGFWHFIMLPEGGGYMAPDCDRVLVPLFMQREQQLYDYIDTHPERSDILRALD